MTMNYTLLTVTLLLVACGAPVGAPAGGVDGGSDGSLPDGARYNVPDSNLDTWCRTQLRSDRGVESTVLLGWASNGQPICGFTCRPDWQTCIAPCDSQPQNNLGGCGGCGVVCPTGFTCYREDQDRGRSPYYCRAIP